MNCPYCGSRLSIRDRCDRCGEDMTIFKKVYRIANQYYNIGVRKAQVRDLSGAVMALPEEGHGSFKENSNGKARLFLQFVPE